MNPRSIKVELAGDYFYRKTAPKIRLQGQWLDKLGFKANGRVTIHPVATGELLLKFDTSTLNYQPLTIH